MTKKNTKDGISEFRRLVDSNFLRYASYVICDRALPNLEDGLKPVQRRILYSLHEKDDGRFTKVANVVGHSMQYHPHGDSSITAALVALTAKGFLIEGQGNFGNLFTGDDAAAARYIECRLTDLARKELFNDALTDFVPSYDGRSEEPVLLPAKIPLLLMQGADGIAVGMGTKILPHNFLELLEAQIAELNKKPFTLLPDFAQGGLMDVSEYDRGNGRVKVRARIVEKDDRTLVVTELPYGITTESLISSIEDAVRKKRAPIRSINDFTSERVEIELVLLPDATPATAMDALYAFTNCEASVSGRVVLLHDGSPVETDVHLVLRENTRLLVKTLEKGLKHRQYKLLEALHAKTLVQIFIENRIYKRIEECKTQESVQKAILAGLKPFRKQFRRAITKADIEMLLGVRIRRISRFDIDRNRQEIDDIVKELDHVRRDLKRLKPYTVRYLRNLLKTYGEMYPRKTEIVTFEEVAVRELTASELEIRRDRSTGYIGYGVEGKPALNCSSLDKLVLVWRDGRYRVVPPPEKMFADKDLLYCARYDRDHVFTMVYTQTDIGFTYVKRFCLGGTIMNREYRCTPSDSRILVFADDAPEDIYVKYRPAKGQRIHQQLFHPQKIPARGVKAIGNQMTAKRIAAISTSRPHWWKKGKRNPKGVVV